MMIMIEMVVFMSEVHSFNKSLKRGQKGEAQFHDLFKDKVDRTAGYIEDFIIKKNNKTIDVKTDFYDMGKTENFFMERYSYGQEDGGAWQALKKGVDYYIYFFPSHMEFFVFKTATLVKKLEELCNGAYLIGVKNTSHLTRGYKVKREDLECIRLNIMEIL